MKLMQLTRCLIGRHKRDRGVTVKDGVMYSRCIGCGRRMVRSGPRWRLVRASK
ncbi:hypothetical protein [Stakelama tenebrarum]|uniref:Uncharacterized protein n=1 Tax=Stakelama tenebrarum TaxID=2711215 RepID=A0A6G6Y970_9SPHN|nr:hypothetical protein [Sphingosinithalassobacter tenebrarum]QIG81116.1 hypothetical protein G5C33_15900 [Sphingosinithalassobacter tenebrarum]